MDGRLRFFWGARDLAGRTSVVHGTEQASRKTASRVAVAGVDTILYSQGGRIFLRDTASASRSGIVGTCDTTWNDSIIYGWLTDARDGRIYRTVKIGPQVWMAQNLDYAGTTSWTYLEDTSLAIVYARYYTWAGALALPDSCDRNLCASLVEVRRRGICPSGWHVPSEAEWTRLTDTLLAKATAATVLKARSGWDWGRDAGGRDSMGFRALPGGWVDGPKAMYYSYALYGKWWTSGEMDATRGQDRYMYGSTTPTVTSEAYGKSFGLHLRCLAD